MKDKKNLLALFFWVIAFSSMVVFIVELAIPSDPNSIVFINYSKFKLFQLVVLLFITVLFSLFASFTQFSISFKKRISEFLINNAKVRYSILFITLSILLICIGILTLDDPQIILLKLQLFIIWLAFVSLFISIFLIQMGIHPTGIQKKFYFRNYSIFLLLITFLFSIFIFHTSNLNSLDQGQSTIAITWHQGLFLFWIFLTLEYFKLFKFTNKSVGKWVTIFLLLVLFFAAGSLWNSIIFRGSYNMVGPFGPESEWFPHSDSTRFDTAAQSIFIGEGINYHKYVDNPLMVNYVALLHFICGGSFSSLITFQVWLFAIIPVLIFLTGKTVSGVSVGIGSAFFYIFRVTNILINTNNTGLVSPKVLLSECILEPLLILFTFSVIVWFGNQKKNVLSLIIAGGIFGLCALVRANVWFIFPLLLILVLHFTKPFGWKSIGNCLVVIISTCIILLPWMYRSTQTINTPFFMLYKFQNSIVNERYSLESSIDIPASQNTKEDSENIEETTVTTTPKNKEPNSNYKIINNTWSSTFKKYIGIFDIIYKNSIYGFSNSLFLLPSNSYPISTVSGVIFPKQFLNDFYKQPQLIKVNIAISFLLSVMVFTCGITEIYKNKKVAYLLIGEYFSYIIASAVALTAGSRYSQPVEWIFIIIYSVGCSLIARTIFSLSSLNQKETSDSQSSLTNGDIQTNTIIARRPIYSYLAIVIILCISILMIIPDYVGNPLYPEVSHEVTIDEINQNSNTRINNLPSQNSENFVSGNGRVIYSLTLNGNKEYSHPFFTQRPYLNHNGNDTLVLFVISSSGEKWVKINIQQQDWPNQSLVWKEVSYIGCNKNKFIQLYDLMAKYDDGSKVIYQSNPVIFCGK